MPPANFVITFALPTGNDRKAASQEAAFVFLPADYSSLPANLSRA